MFSADGDQQHISPFKKAHEDARLAEIEMVCHQRSSRSCNSCMFPIAYFNLDGQMVAKQQISTARSPLHCWFGWYVCYPSNQHWTFVATLVN